MIKRQFYVNDGQYYDGIFKSAAVQPFLTRRYPSSIPGIFPCFSDVIPRLTLVIGPSLKQHLLLRKHIQA